MIIMNQRYEDVAECAWCGEIIILVEDSRGVYLCDVIVGGVPFVEILEKKIWVHKGTGKLHCANGKSAATQKRGSGE